MDFEAISSFGSGAARVPIVEQYAAIRARRQEIADAGRGRLAPPPRRALRGEAARSGCGTQTGYGSCRRCCRRTVPW